MVRFGQKLVSVLLFAWIGIASAGSKECSKHELGTLFLPLFEESGELDWSPGLRACLYGLGLLWCFLGVAIVADIFMVAIEYITSQERTVVNSDGATIPVRIWNATVANLTLMALGSSAPEILLSVIEIVGNDFYSGELGPSTIVGSAAFNLLVILAVCVLAIPPTVQGGRKIENLGVYAITAVFSIFAYLWLIFILIITSPDVIEIWEAVVTLLCFPVLVALAYATDREFLSIGKDEDDPFKDTPAAHIIDIAGFHETIDGASAQALQDMLAALSTTYATLSQDEKERMLMEKLRSIRRPTRAEYRVLATRSLLGGKKEGSAWAKRERVGSHAIELPKLPLTVLEEHLGENDADVPEPGQFVGMCSIAYAVVESSGVATLEVERSATHFPLMVNFKTRDGTATGGEDFEHVSGTLSFVVGQKRATITINILDDDDVEDDEHFFVTLSEPRPNAALIPGKEEAMITIIDDDLPGQLGFKIEDTAVSCQESCGTISLPVCRTNGAKGLISVDYHVEDMSAISGEHYEPVSGTLNFRPGEVINTIEIAIIDKKRFGVSHQFKVVLHDVKLYADVSEATASKASLSQYSGSIVTILHDGASKEFMDKVMKRLSIDKDKYNMGTSAWAEQFENALTVGVDSKDGDSGSPSVYILHFITLPWKLVFALIPPTAYAGGWACFVFAISLIGLVTALIGDLATLFGCTIGLKNPVTAITFVALGTSLPDTFASQAAARGDPTADASIGNVTGSNSVNVFLGLGLPWTLAAVYWRISGATKEWKERYGDEKIRVPGTDATADTIGYEYKDGAFVVPAGALSSSVAVFCVCGLACLITLAVRRKYLGCELGGPRGPAVATAAFFVLLWLIYVILSALQEYDYIEF